MIWKLSRYWNRLAFALMKLGKKMIWDYTGKNQDLLKDHISKDTEDVMCGRS